MSRPSGNSEGSRPRPKPAGSSREILAGDFKMSDGKRRGSLMLLELSGRLDGRAAQLVQQRCAELRAQGMHVLGLDLSQVTFLASSGLGVFLAETEEFKEAKGSLHLIAVSSVVSSVVNLLNVGRFLSLVPSVDDLVVGKGSR